MAEAAVFFDRDGTLIEDVGYLGDPEGIVIYGEAIEAVSAIREAGLKVFIVTNQSGLARGMFDEKTLIAIHDVLKDAFQHQGAPLDAIYFCPHHPEATVERYRRHCRCRKPEPGLLRRAAEAFEIDLGRSYMIGDKLDDIVAGHRAGCRSVLVRTGQGRRSEEALKSMPDPRLNLRPDFIADDALGAVEWILEERRAAVEDH